MSHKVENDFRNLVKTFDILMKQKVLERLWSLFVISTSKYEFDFGHGSLAALKLIGEQLTTHMWWCACIFN